MTVGIWKANIIHVALDLELFTKLQKTQKTSEELSKLLNINMKDPSQMFEILVQLQLLEKNEKNEYKNTVFSEKFFNKLDQLNYFGAQFQIYVKHELLANPENLKNALQNPKPKEKFDMKYKDQKFFEMMAKRMHGTQIKLAQKLPYLDIWKNYKQIVDIGSNVGYVTLSILDQNKHMTGIISDLQQLKPFCDKFIIDFNLQERCQFQEIDFLKQDFPKTDVILFGQVLHDWDFSVKEMLLNKAYNAINSGGACVIYEPFINTQNIKVGQLIMSLFMSIIFQSQEMRIEQGQELLEKAGFCNIQHQNILGEDEILSLIIGFKP